MQLCQLARASPNMACTLAFRIGGSIMDFFTRFPAQFQSLSSRFDKWAQVGMSPIKFLSLLLLASGSAYAGTPENTGSPGAGNQSFATRYPTFYAANTCSSCHTSIPALQSYGAAYKVAVVGLGGRTQANVGPALASIESADADGDGYSNIVEITNSKQPWNASDHPTAAVALSTGQNAKSGAAGTTVSYSVTITNNGNLVDSFTLGVSVTAGQTWTPTIVGSANSIAAGGTANITVNVVIAGGAAAAQTSTTTVTATSQANTGISATALQLTTTASSAAIAATRYVNAATGVNTGTCAVQANPCKTITYGMSQASTGNPGDLLSVAPGTYNLALGEVFPITFRSGVQLISTGSPADTIIDAAGDTMKQAILTSANNTSAFARIEGFTFRNGRNLTPTQGGVSLGGAVRLSNSSALFTITRNIFTGNQTTGYSADNTSGQTGGLGWGGAIYGSSSTVEISNNVFTSNIALGGNGYTDFATGPCTNRNAGQGEGGAIYIFGSGKIINNTFYGNTAQGGAGGGGQACTGNGGTATSGAVTTGSGIMVSNNIFAANASVGGAGAAAGSASAGAMSASGATITNNLFFGNTLSGTAGSVDTTGSNVLTSDPQFHSAPSILKILIGSPASGAGTSTGAPALDFAGSTRPTPPAIGAYEPSSAITFSAVQSRKTHGGTGDYDIAIDTTQAIGGLVTVEPRIIGGGHSIVFQFSGTVTSAGTVSVTPVGAVVAAIGANTSEVVVTLTGVADNQRATVTLTGVNGTVNPPATSIGFLVGDVNNTRSVNSSDISGVKARSGQVTTAAIFKYDLNANGSVTASDISAVKARSGLLLP